MFAMFVAMSTKAKSCLKITSALCAMLAPRISKSKNLKSKN